jgi:hypothetical protein
MPFEFKAWLSEKLGRDQRVSVRIPPAARKAAATPYHAVSIKPGHQCCEGAKQFAGMRFLSAKVPKLPLPDCQAPVCTCRYSHFADRRSVDDRRGLMEWHRHRPRPDNVERRQGRQGRRATDAIS